MTSRDLVPSSEDLIPQDLPQGSRQQIVSQARQLGLPIDSSQLGESQGPPPVVINPQQAFRAADPSFDALSNRQPTMPLIPEQGPQQPDPIAQFKTAAANSNNAIMRAIAARLPDVL